MRRFASHLAIAACAVAAPLCVAQPPIACPWLTLGTASHLLGESASVRVQLAGDGTGSCLFQPQSPQSAPDSTSGSTPSPTLALTVSAHASAACDAHATPLRGIGNHAEECLPHASPSVGMSMVVTRIAGQVRDHWFVLDAAGLPQTSLHNPLPRWPDESTLPTQLELAAEQVADNLY